VLASDCRGLKVVPSEERGPKGTLAGKVFPGVLSPEGFISDLTSVILEDMSAVLDEGPDGGGREDRKPDSTLAAGSCCDPVFIC
jgi:hypothetical protein